tara:strand:- start:672 stop:1091 length:420 start_codon:yes stop_codon:yes gene_type:complete
VNVLSEFPCTNQTLVDISSTSDVAWPIPEPVVKSPVLLIQNSTETSFTKLVYGDDISTKSSIPSKFKCVASGLTVTTISDLVVLSHPLLFILDTQYEVEPGVDVEGVGAALEPVPPVDIVYHNKLSPPLVAVNAVAVSN